MTQRISVARESLHVAEFMLLLEHSEPLGTSTCALCIVIARTLNVSSLYRDFWIPLEFTMRYIEGDRD